MPLKKFDDYLEGKSSDPSVFEKKVIFATQGGQCDFFKTISEESQIISETSSMPIVIWGDFKFRSGLARWFFQPCSKKRCGLLN